MKTESFVTLEVGEKYLSREGKVVEIVSEDCFTVFPFYGNNNEEYLPNGYHYSEYFDTASYLLSLLIQPLTIHLWFVF